MIWGCGSGRCGTKSLATQFGGLHEPQPWILQEAAKYLNNPNDEENTERLRNILGERNSLDTSLVVDLKHSWCLPLIDEIDPDAKYVVMFRNPILTISSYMRTNTWTGHVVGKFLEEETFPQHPDPDVPTIDKAIHYWNVTYMTIGDFFKWSSWQDHVEFRNVDTLDVHVNQHPVENHQFTNEEAAYIMDKTTYVYEGLQDLEESWDNYSVL